MKPATTNKASRSWRPRAGAVALIALMVLATAPLVEADTWESEGFLTTQKSDAAAVYTGTYAYIFGGWERTSESDGGQRVDDIVRYNPSTGSFTTLTSSLPNPVVGISAVWTGSVAYIFGGSTGGGISDKIVKFDPSTNTVTTMAAKLPTPRTDTSAVWIGGSAYIFGGFNVPSSYYDDVVKYTPSTGTVTVMSGNFPGSGYANTAAVTDGSKAYIFGGFGNNPVGHYTNTIWQYNPATDSLTDTGDNLPSRRTSVLALWHDGHAYLFGGWHDSSIDPESSINGIHRYEPSTGTRTKMAESTTFWHYDAFGVFANGEFHILGSKQRGSYTEKHWTYSLEPGAPSSLSATTGSTGSIGLSWSAPPSNSYTASITGYQVYRSDSSGNGYSLRASLGNTLSYTDTGLANGDEKFYKVRAINSDGTGDFSAVESAITLPGTVTSFTASAGSRGVINTDWNAPSGGSDDPVSSYRVYRSTFSSGSYSLIDTVTSSSYSDTGLPDDVTRYYKVQAVSQGGLMGSLSGAVSATTITVPPSVPLNFGVAYGPGNDEISLDWSPPSNNGGDAVDNYRVYRASSSSGLYSLIASPTASSYTDTGVLEGEEFWYKVSAVNNAGEGDLTTADNALHPVLPPTVSGIIGKVFGWTNSVPNLDSLSWQDTESGLELARYTTGISTTPDPGATWLNMPTQPSSGQTTTWNPSWNPGGLAQGVNFVHTRVSDVAGGETQTNAAYEVRYDTVNPTTPSVSSSTWSNQNLWYSDPSGTVSWSASDATSGINGYSYNLASGSSVTVDTTKDAGAGATSEFYSGLGPFGEHTFGVRAVDRAGNWGPVETRSIRVDNVDPVFDTTVQEPPPGSTVDDEFHKIHIRYHDFDTVGGIHQDLFGDTTVDAPEVTFFVDGVDMRETWENICAPKGPVSDCRLEITSDLLLYEPLYPWTHGTHVVDVGIQDTVEGANTATTSWNFNVDAVPGFDFDAGCTPVAPMPGDDVTCFAWVEVDGNRVIDESHTETVPTVPNVDYDAGCTPVAPAPGDTVTCFAWVEIDGNRVIDESHSETLPGTSPGDGDGDGVPDELEAQLCGRPLVETLIETAGAGECVTSSDYVPPDTAATVTIPVGATPGADADGDGVPADVTIHQLDITVDPLASPPASTAPGPDIVQEVDPDDTDENNPVPYDQVPETFTVPVPIPIGATPGADADGDGVPADVTLHFVEVTVDRTDPLDPVKLDPAPDQTHDIDPDDTDENNPVPFDQVPETVTVTVPTGVSVGGDGDNDGLPSDVTIQNTDVIIDRTTPLDPVSTAPAGDTVHDVDPNDADRDDPGPVGTADPDGDFIPDAAEFWVCQVQDRNTDLDGRCVRADGSGSDGDGDNYVPPVPVPNPWNM